MKNGGRFFDEMRNKGRIEDSFLFVIFLVLLLVVLLSVFFVILFPVFLVLVLAVLFVLILVLFLLVVVILLFLGILKLEKNVVIGMDIAGCYSHIFREIRSHVFSRTAACLRLMNKKTVLM